MHIDKSDAFRIFVSPEHTIWADNFELFKDFKLFWDYVNGVKNTELSRMNI